MKKLLHIAIILILFFLLGGFLFSKTYATSCTDNSQCSSSQFCYLPAARACGGSVCPGPIDTCIDKTTQGDQGWNCAPGSGGVSSCKSGLFCNSGGRESSPQCQAGTATPTPYQTTLCSGPTPNPCFGGGHYCNFGNGSQCCGTCDVTDKSRGVAGFCSYAPSPAPITSCHTYSQGSCGTGSICYDGDLNTDHIVPGAQCGTLQGWHFGSDGSGNVPKCGIIGNPYCCDQGGAMVNFTYQQPCIKDSKGNCTAVATGFGNIPISVTAAISAIFAILLSFSGGIVLIIIIFSGYRIMTSGGDQEKLKGAREMLTAGIIGLLFIIFSVTILRIIGVDILRIPGFSGK